MFPYELNEIRGCTNGFFAFEPGRTKNGVRARGLKGEGWGRVKKGTLAHKSLNSEKCPPTTHQLFTVDFTHWLTVCHWVSQLQITGCKFFFPSKQILLATCQSWEKLRCHRPKQQETPSKLCRICRCSFKVKFGTASQPGKPCQKIFSNYQNEKTHKEKSLLILAEPLELKKWNTTNYFQTMYAILVPAK